MALEIDIAFSDYLDLDTLQSNSKPDEINHYFCMANYGNSSKLRKSRNWYIDSGCTHHIMFEENASPRQLRSNLPIKW